MNESKQAMLDALGMFFRVLRTESRMMADGYELQVTKADYNKAREALAALRASAPQADVRAVLEPVAWRWRYRRDEELGRWQYNNDHPGDYNKSGEIEIEPLYAAPLHPQPKEK